MRAPSRAAAVCPDSVDTQSYTAPVVSIARCKYMRHGIIFLSPLLVSIKSTVQRGGMGTRTSGKTVSGGVSGYACCCAAALQLHRKDCHI